MKVVVAATGAVRYAKLQRNRHHQQTNTQLFTGWMPFLSPNQQCQSTEGNTNTVIFNTYHKSITAVNAYQFIKLQWDYIADTCC